MTEWTTIRVHQDAKEKAEERKPDNMTWSEYIASDEYEPDNSIMDKLESVETIAEQARDNTEDIKRGMP